jgi:hypothetical protein
MVKAKDSNLAEPKRLPAISSLKQTMVLILVLIALIVDSSNMSVCCGANPKVFTRMH